MPTPPCDTVEPGQPQQRRPRVVRVEAGVHGAREGPGHVEAVEQRADHLDVHLAQPVQESQHEAVGAGVQVTPDEPAQPHCLAAVGRVAAPQPQERTQVQRRSRPDRRHLSRLGRHRPVVREVHELEPVRPAGLGGCGVVRAQHPHLEQP